MSVEIAPIVEGHGDVAALPVLLRAIEPLLIVRRPVRFPRTRLLDEGHLERAARIAASNIVHHGVVLLVVDADDDCAAELSVWFAEKLRNRLPDVASRVVLAVHEFEAWIVGGDDAYGVTDADSAGRLKERIRERHGVYSETADQARLIARADLELLQERSRSFRKLRKVVAELLSPP